MVVLLSIVGAYLIGSIPNGYLIVRLYKNRDLTLIGSGRTGGTNAMRAGGLGAGVLTALLDLLKGVLAIWWTRWLLSGQILAISPYPWIEALAGVAVVIGHNWSILLRGRGGAGTGPNVGVAVAFWPFALLILPPFVPLVLFGTGYASVASLATAGLIPVLFVLLAGLGGMPWEYVVYGVATCALVTWALRPNISRLLAGQERRVGPRAAAGRNRKTPRA